MVITFVFAIFTDEEVYKPFGLSTANKNQETKSYGTFAKFSIDGIFDQGLGVQFSDKVC